MERDGGDLTLETYEAIADSYAERNATRVAEVVSFIDTLAQRLPAGASVLELGSGPGHDADLLEQRGLKVVRTDGAEAFVAMNRSRGREAQRLDVRRDPLGGPYDAIFAMAVLLHLTVDEFTDVLRRARTAVRPGGILAVTLKEGDGAELTTAKVGRPRWFTYWREGSLRNCLTLTGWTVDELAHVEGNRDDWLHVLAH